MLSTWSKLVTNPLNKPSDWVGWSMCFVIFSLYTEVRDIKDTNFILEDAYLNFKDWYKESKWSHSIMLRLWGIESSMVCCRFLYSSHDPSASKLQSGRPLTHGCVALPPWYHSHAERSIPGSSSSKYYFRLALLLREKKRYIVGHHDVHKPLALTHLSSSRSENWCIEILLSGWWNLVAVSYLVKNFASWSSEKTKTRCNGALRRWWCTKWQSISICMVHTWKTSLCAMCTTLLVIISENRMINEKSILSSNHLNQTNF